MFRHYRDAVRIAKEKKCQELTDAFTCEMCDKGGWLSPNDVEIHKKKAHGKILRELAKLEDRFCTVCMTLLDSYGELLEHVKTQHLLSSPNAQRIERVIYICDECSHVFFNKDVLATHMLSVHLSTKSDRMFKFFTCPKCHKSYRLDTLWFHLQQHEMPSVSLCDICLCNFPNRTALNEHIKTHKSYLKCEPCDYMSSHVSQFESHMQQHKQKKLLQRELSQDLLSNVFKKGKSRLVRFNMHNAIKGLNLPKFIQICTLCREICVSNGERKRHMLRDHFLDKVEKKRHLCVCGEEFDYKVVLKQHLLKMKGNHFAVEENVGKTPSANKQQNSSLGAEPMEATSKAEISLLKTLKLKKLELNKLEIEISGVNPEEPTKEAEKADVPFATLTTLRHDEY